MDSHTSSFRPSSLKSTTLLIASRIFKFLMAYRSCWSFNKSRTDESNPYIGASMAKRPRLPRAASSWPFNIRISWFIKTKVFLVWNDQIFLKSIKAKNIRRTPNILAVKFLDNNKKLSDVFRFQNRLHYISFIMRNQKSCLTTDKFQKENVFIFLYSGGETPPSFILQKLKYFVILSKSLWHFVQRLKYKIRAVSW